MAVITVKDRMAVITVKDRMAVITVKDRMAVKLLKQPFLRIQFEASTATQFEKDYHQTKNALERKKIGKA